MPLVASADPYLFIIFRKQKSTRSRDLDGRLPRGAILSILTYTCLCFALMSLSTPPLDPNATLPSSVPWHPTLQGSGRGIMRILQFSGLLSSDTIQVWCRRHCFIPFICVLDPKTASLVLGKPHTGIFHTPSDHEAQAPEK
jgi:hypothetical protein